MPTSEALREDLKELVVAARAQTVHDAHDYVLRRVQQMDTSMDPNEQVPWPLIGARDDLLNIPDALPIDVDKILARIAETYSHHEAPLPEVKTRVRNAGRLAAAEEYFKGHPGEPTTSRALYEALQPRLPGITVKDAIDILYQAKKGILKIPGGMFVGEPGWAKYVPDVISVSLKPDTVAPADTPSEARDTGIGSLKHNPVAPSDDSHGVDEQAKPLQVTAGAEPTIGTDGKAGTVPTDNLTDSGNMKLQPSLAYLTSNPYRDITRNEFVDALVKQGFPDIDEKTASDFFDALRRRALQPPDGIVKYKHPIIFYMPLSHKVTCAVHVPKISTMEDIYKERPDFRPYFGQIEAFHSDILAARSVLAEKDIDIFYNALAALEKAYLRRPTEVGRARQDFLGIVAGRGAYASGFMKWMARNPGLQGIDGLFQLYGQGLLKPRYNPSDEIPDDILLRPEREANIQHGVAAHMSY